MDQASWSRFPKIADSTGSFEASSSSSTFVVTEKIHGANFSIIVHANGTVAFASRSGPLADSDNFFGYRSQGLHTLLSPRARVLRDALVESNATTADAAVTIYGELCGGAYPHPEVPAAAGALPVQNGIWYAPSLIFVGFDVAVTVAGSPIRFLSFDLARTRALAAGFRFATPLHIGPLSSCISYDVRFSS